MDVTLPNGQLITGVPDGTPKAEIQRKAIAGGLASQHDFDVFDQTNKYQGDISEAEQANGLPPGSLNALISVESSGDHTARSKANAIGLTQVLPTTLVDMGYDEAEVAKSPKLQIQAGAQYLGQMLKATDGNMARALTAYHSGLGNLQKYESGEKQMGPETAAYATDPRFARFVQQPQQQQAPAQGDNPEDELANATAQTNQGWSQPEPQAPIGEQIADAGRGLAQGAVNVANIPGSVVNTALGAVGVPQQDQVMTLQLPESMRPRSQEAKIGAEIAPYLIPVPGVQAESLASTVAKGADALLPKVASIIERNVPQSIAENTVGALAQNASSGNQNNFGPQIAQDTALSLGARGALHGVSQVADVVRARRAAAVAPETAPAAGAADEAAGAVPPEAAPNPTPAAASDVPPQAAGTSEEEALRAAALRTGGDIPPNDPALASSLDGLNIQPRADVQQAAQRLGMGDDLLPSHLSGNEQYQAVEQAIKSRPGSALKVQEDEAIGKLANSAGKLIDDVTKADSPLDLSARFNNEYDMRMAALEHRSDQLYKRVDEALPQNTPVNAPITAQHVTRMADDVGGWENLSTPEKNVFKAVMPAGEKMPDGTMADGVLTYARLNRIRKDIGNALGKKQGVYKDEDQAVLSGLYARLSEDQKNILGDVGARRDFEVANRLVQMRKGMEERMVALRGKDLAGDVTRRASLAVQSMGRGNMDGFRRLFETTGGKGKKAQGPLIATRSHRQELLANAIGDQLSAGKRGSDFSPAGFADWYGNLQKNGGLNLIAKHMPSSFMAQLRDLHTVADAIRRAKGKEITTGRLNDFTRRFDRVNKAAQLIADNANKAGAAIGGMTGGGFGAAIGAAAGSKVAQAAERMGGAGASEAAEKLVSSPAYQAQVRRLAGADPANVDTVVQDVNNQVKKLPQYRELMLSLPKEERARLARLGLIAWVNSADTNQEQK